MSNSRIAWKEMVADWRRYIRRRWRIIPVESVKAVWGPALWTTRCSRTKPVPQGFPHEMYLSPITNAFFRFVHKHGLRYGVLSDRYGLHLDIERLPYYDVHPSELSDADKQALGLAIRRKVEQLGFDRIVFYNVSPLMSVPYFEMLFYSGLPTYFIRSLSPCNRSRGEAAYE